MEPKEILEKTIEMIEEYSGGDPDKRFYANRYVFARLQLYERQAKAEIKKVLLDAEARCHYCGERFESGGGIHVHRLDGDRGYSQENCVLLHPECHQRFHAENPTTSRGAGRPRKHPKPRKTKVSVRNSKRYEGHSFHYWWDISPNGFVRLMKNCDAVHLQKKDTGEFCGVPTAALKGFFTKERQTSRHEGNWGIKVFKDEPDNLAFEPGEGKDDWLFLPVVWEPPEEEA